MPKPSPPAWTGAAAPQRPATLRNVFDQQDIHAAFAWAFAGAAQELASNVSAAGRGRQAKPCALFVLRVRVLLARMLLDFAFDGLAFGSLAGFCRAFGRLVQLCLR